MSRKRLLRLSLHLSRKGENQSKRHDKRFNPAARKNSSERKTPLVEVTESLASSRCKLQHQSPIILLIGMNNSCGGRSLSLSLRRELTTCSLSDKGDRYGRPRTSKSDAQPPPRERVELAEQKSVRRSRQTIYAKCPAKKMLVH